jgi:hypothetical protein
MHDTFEKGDLGQAKITCDLIDQGYEILVPYSATSPFDLVVYKDGQFTKVQVKYRGVYRGAIYVPCSRTVQTWNGVKRRGYLAHEVDVVAIYCPDTDKCYYVKYVVGRNITLRITPPKNNQKAKVRLAADHESLGL